MQWLGLATKWLTLVYCLGLALGLTVAEVVGERSRLTGILIYGPITFWLLPLAFLVPLVLLFARQMLWAPVFSVIFVLFCFGDFHCGQSRPSGGLPMISVLSNNVGQNNKQTFVPFAEKMLPDVIAIQESNYAAAMYRQAYPDWNVAGKGQFIVFSKETIFKWDFLEQPRWRGYPVAARFEMEIRGTRFALYNVHLPTPRGDLTKFSVREMAMDVLDPLAKKKTKGQKTDFSDSIVGRVGLVESLVEEILKDPLPTIVVGDFNMPDVGYAYGKMRAQFTDAFAECGWGYGYTFPGFTRNPLSFFKPWLRLDYAFCDEAWRPLECVVEPDRPSQHRAVFARFELLKK